MSLLVTESQIKLPTHTHSEKKPPNLRHHFYHLSKSRLLILSNYFDYLVFDQFHNKPSFSGHLQEPPESSYILKSDSYWFTEHKTQQDTLVYLSPKTKKITFFDLQKGKIELVWDMKPIVLKQEKYSKFFNWIHYVPESQKCRIVYQSDSSITSIIDVMQEKGRVKPVENFRIKNPNCICQEGETLIFGSQIMQSSPLKIFVVKGDQTGLIEFHFKSNLTLVEYGFFGEEEIFVLYNENYGPKSGIFLLKLGSLGGGKEEKKEENEDGENLDDGVENKAEGSGKGGLGGLDKEKKKKPILLKFYEGNEDCQKVVFESESGEPDCFDGRIIVDSLRNTVTVKGLVRKSKPTKQRKSYFRDFLLILSSFDPLMASFFYFSSFQFFSIN